MRVFYTDQFVLPLPQGHRFPTSKYALLRERVFASGLFAPDELCVPRRGQQAVQLAKSVTR